MPRDPSRQGALLAAGAVAVYLPLQLALGWAAGMSGMHGSADLDPQLRWTSMAVVILLGAGLATVLGVDWRRRRGAGSMQRWTTGTAAGLAVLLFLSGLLTVVQAFLTWSSSHAAAIALVLDALVLSWLGGVAFVAVQPRD